VDVDVVVVVVVPVVVVSASGQRGFSALASTFASMSAARTHLHAHCREAKGWLKYRYPESQCPFERSSAHSSSKSPSAPEVLSPVPVLVPEVVAPSLGGSVSTRAHECVAQMHVCAAPSHLRMASSPVAAATPHSKPSRPHPAIVTLLVATTAMSNTVQAALRVRLDPSTSL